MSKKQQEPPRDDDSRDIWERVADYAVPIGAAVVGAGVGSRIGRLKRTYDRIGRGLKKTADRPDSLAEFNWALNQRAKHIAEGEVGGGLAGVWLGGTGGLLQRREHYEGKKKSRKRK